MDILMLSDVYFPRVNGVSTSIRTLALGLVRLGHRVTLVAPDYFGARDEPVFELIRLPARRIFFDPEDRLIRGAALDRIERKLIVRKFDVIHVHTPFQAHRLGVRLRRATGAPMVETYHTHFEAYVAHYLPWAPGGLLRWCSRVLTRRLAAPPTT
jgi:glycosyltransferase involved in cell wall biosynthesis